MVASTTGELLPDWTRSYASRRVLVTGHTGFKGAWLSLWLCRLGADVTGFSLQPPSEPNLFDLAGVESMVHHMRGDVRDSNAVSAAIQRVKPEIIFHLAAQPIVRQSYTDPIETLQTNVMGTANVLDAVRSLRMPMGVVVVTSDKCYENRESGSDYTETDRLGGKDIYSVSKAAAELVAAGYRTAFFPVQTLSQHGVAVATTRAGNIIGGGDWGADRLLPDCLRALLRGTSVPVRNPDSVRPWQYVLDALHGYLLVGAGLAPSSTNREVFADAWNFGPDHHDVRTVRQLVDKVVETFGAGAWHHEAGKGFAEANLLRISNEKSRLALGWRPLWTFDTMVEATVNWYRDCAGGASAKLACERAIIEHMGMLSPPPPSLARQQDF